MILPRVQDAAEQGLPSQAREVIAYAIAATLLSAIIVSLRFYTRGVLLRVLGLEDCFIGLSMVSFGTLAHLLSFPAWANHAIPINVFSNPHRLQLCSIGNAIGMCFREHDPLHTPHFKLD